MAVDKKSDHVGNHGGAYTDINGMRKQFTVIDHDKNTSRLKSLVRDKEYKAKMEQEPIIPTAEEILINDIHQSGMTSNDIFISEFDNVFSKKYGFERYRKGRTIENLSENRGPDWYVDLEKLFKKALDSQISELQQFLNKDYGIQSTTDKEDN